MSRIGKKIIFIPKDITIEILNQYIHIKGIYGTLSKKFLPSVKLSILNDILQIENIGTDKKSNSYYGSIRTIVQNMILGVSQNYSKILILQGIGFKFQLEKSLLFINIGYTHSYKIIIPDFISVQLESSTKLKIFGIDKEKVNLFASIIYNIKPPEPYKGKGILYENQHINKKPGKVRK